MDDSFLKDLELVSHVKKQKSTNRQQTSSISLRNDRSPSTVFSMTSSPIGLDLTIAPQMNTSTPNISKHKNIKGSTPKEIDKHKLKVNIKTRTDNKNLDNGKKSQKHRLKVSGNFDYFQRSTSRSPDASGKENSYPSNVSKDSQKESPGDKVYLSRHSTQAHDSISLDTIKDIVDQSGKEESTKILMEMQQFYYKILTITLKNSIKMDDIIELLQPNKETNHFKGLIEENENLRASVITLQTRNALLEKRLEEFETVKEENTMLKLKCKALSKEEL